jgi:hypothetical protein
LAEKIQRKEKPPSPEGCAASGGTAQAESGLQLALGYAEGGLELTLDR